MDTGASSHKSENGIETISVTILNPAANQKFDVEFADKFTSQFSLTIALQKLTFIRGITIPHYTT